MKCYLLAMMAALLPAMAVAQTANGSPTDPAPQGLVGTPRPVSRTAPSVGTARKGATAPSTLQAVPKETAADRAERLKLEKDLRICIGC